jgi:Xaa-Pro dipeptidase
MQEKELDGMIVTSNDNVFYATGIPVTRGQRNPILFALSNKFPPYAVIDPEGMPVPIVWAGAIGNHELWAKEYATSFLPNGTTEELISLLPEKFSKGARIGIEASMPYQLGEIIKSKIDEAELIVANEVLEELRLIKSAEEIAKMRSSLEIAEKAEEKIFEEARSDWSVYKFASRSGQLLFEEGATGVDHTTIAIGKSNPEILEDFIGTSGDVVVLDIGAILDGYVSDTRRLGCIERPGPELTELNQTMSNIVVETGKKSLQPGRSFSDICGDVEARYLEHGREPTFLKAGHTIGIQTEEEWILRGSTRSIQENMVINIELYSALKSGISIGTKDTFLVTSAGGEQLSHQPHDIVSIR